MRKDGLVGVQGAARIDVEYEVPVSLDDRFGRRRALDAQASSPGAWDEIRLAFTDAGRLVDELCWYGPDVRVRSPQDVVDGVVTRLREAAREGA